jgi:hypothetical protein
VFYLGFSREGWTDDARAYAAELAAAENGRGNWSVGGVQLLDLAQVDQEMSDWHASLI